MPGLTMQEPVQAVNLNTARSAKASTKEAPTDVGEIAEDSFLEESTLDATEFLAKVVPTVVGVWDLEATHTESDAPEAEFFAHTSGGDETVVGDDNRKPVSAVDFAPGGKYRSIVKLFLHFAKQKPGAPWAMATGWLIAPNLLVTAGHCANDWSHNLGQVKEIKAYIGYHGKDNVKDPSVQFRHGKKIAAPAEWLNGPAMTRDVSFVRLDKPFTGIRPFKFVDTPGKGTLNLGVVGYPGDLEHGEQMYEHFLKTNFNLAASNKMLTYQIDTNGGNSGSPVLRVPDMTAIGVHTYGGNVNKASVIGPLGNAFADYIRSFELVATGSKDVAVVKNTKIKGFCFVSIPQAPKPQTRPGREPQPKPHHGQSGPIIKGPPITNSKPGVRPPPSKNPIPLPKPVPGKKPLPATHGETKEPADGDLNGDANITSGESSFESADPEGFLDVVKDILRKGLKVSAPMVKGGIRTGAPFALGALGGPLGALAGVALNVLGKSAENYTEDSEADVGPEATMAEVDGVVQRALLGEAALQSLISLPADKLKKEKVHSIMAQELKKYALICRRCRPFVHKAILPTVVEFSLDALSKAGDTEAAVDNISPDELTALGYTSESSDESDAQGPEAENVFTEFLASQGTADAEVSLGKLGNILKKGFQQGLPILEKVAIHGLPLLLSMVETDTGETSESTEAETPAPELEGLTERAMLGEAALQATMKISSETLHGEEGFFDKFAHILPMLTPAILRHGPKLIRGATRLGKEIVQDQAKKQIKGGGKNEDKDKSKRELEEGEEFDDGQELEDGQEVEDGAEADTEAFLTGFETWAQESEWVDN